MAQAPAGASTAAASSSSTTTAAMMANMMADDDNNSNKQKTPTLSHKEFDVKGYISRYKGFTRIQRLSFIAERCPQDHAEVCASIAVADFTQQGTPAQAASAPVGDKVALCTLLYKQVCERIAAARAAVGGSAGVVFDQQWFDATERYCVGFQDKLEKDLNAARASTNKDSIRQAQAELGDFFFRRGDFNMAMKMYSRMRDHCVTPAHFNEMYLRIVKCAIEAKNLNTLPGHVQKATQTTDAKDLVMVAKLRVSSALSELELRSYKQAARKFIETPTELGNTFNDVIAPHDVAVYGGICALATFDRNEIKRMVLENSAFRQFLDYAPSVSRIINDFYRCNYSSCLKEMEKIKLDLLLDIHLFDHVAVLFQKIRDKALVQYFTPYSTVDLKPMSEAFNTTVPDLEKELSKLIVDGSLQARIDSQNKVLVARNADQRLLLFKQALESGDEMQYDLKTSLLRLNLLRNDFCVREKRERGGKDKGDMMQQMMMMQQQMMGGPGMGQFM